MLEEEEDFGDTSIAGAATRDSTSSSSSTPILGSNLSAVMEMERSHSRTIIISNHSQALQYEIMLHVGW